MGGPIDIEQKGVGLGHSWPWPWPIGDQGLRIYQIVIGVTSDVGVLSTHLVINLLWHLLWIEETI